MSPLAGVGKHGRRRARVLLAPAPAVLSRRRRPARTPCPGSACTASRTTTAWPCTSLEVPGDALHHQPRAQPARCSCRPTPSTARSDRFLDVSRVPADGLTEADCLFLLDHFFMANPEHDDPAVPALRRAVPAPRRWAATPPAKRCAASTSATCATCRSGSTSPGSTRSPSSATTTCGSLRDKGRHFTEDDKNCAARQAPGDPPARSCRCTASWPSSGQVELTTTPFYHPILPLLFDKKLAREAMPDVKLPRYTGGYPEDAERARPPGRRAAHAALRHSRRAACGRPRAASASRCCRCWPKHGIRWIATDEEVLERLDAGLRQPRRQGPRPQPRAACTGPTGCARATRSWPSSSATTP